MYLLSDFTVGSRTKSYDSPCIDDNQSIDYYAVIWYFAGITIKIYRIKNGSLLGLQFMEWRIIDFLLPPSTFQSKKVSILTADLFC